MCEVEGDENGRGGRCRNQMCRTVDLLYVRKGDLGVRAVEGTSKPDVR